jgi:membrane-associated phospholipid phosphatase
MSTTPSPIEADYTQGKAPAPAQSWLKGLFAGPISLKRALIILAITILGIAALLPFDEQAIRFTMRLQEGGDLRMGGDLRRELLFIQQYGDIVCLAIVGTALFLADPSRRRRLLDGLAAVLTSALAYQVLKILIGRPRPKFLDPFHFCGPFSTYPLTHDGQTVMRHSWEIGQGISAELWSMPSSHTAAATALSVVLARMYPRLTPLAVVMAIIVGACRVIFVAHYPSDVLAGWATGLLAASFAMDGHWGQRLSRRGLSAAETK